MYLFVNFKAYRESTGPSAKRLMERIEEAFTDEDRIKPVLNPLDSLLKTRYEKYIQHADAISSGAFTGFLPMDLLGQYGYKGIMINHSEHRLPLASTKKSVEFSKAHGLKSLVCASNLEEIKEIAEFGPDMIAYEPPELIGGDISVSVARPEIIKEAHQLVQGTGIELIVGAGVKNGRDVKISRELGAKGVLVASGIVKSMDPIGVIEEMLKNMGD